MISAQGLCAPGRTILWLGSIPTWPDTFSPQARYPLHHYRKNFQFSESLNWTRGAHFLRIGAMCDATC